MAQLIGRRRQAAASSKGNRNRSTSPSMTEAPGRHRGPTGLRSAPVAPSSPSKGKENPSASPSMTGVPGRHRGPMGPRPAAASTRPLSLPAPDSVMHEYPEVELQNVKNSIEYFQDSYFCREATLKPSKTESDEKKVRNVTGKLTGAWKRYRQLRSYCEEVSEAMNAAKGSGILAADANDKAAKGLHGENVL